jgi:hypothetical protein
MKGDVKTSGQPTRLAQVMAAGSVMVAFLASQHHLLHMLIFLVTFGTAGVSFMSAFPLLRRGMVLMSLVMVGVTLWQMWRWRCKRSMAVFGGISVALTLSLIMWSIAQFGL